MVKEKILNYLNRIELDKKKIILIIFSCLIISYLDFSFFIKLHLKGIGSMTPKITQLRKDVDSLMKDLSNMQELKRGQDEVVKHAGVTLSKRIVTEDEMPLLLQDIADIANKNNVKIMQINPIRDTKSQEEVVAGSKFLPITITLDLSCIYHSLGGFVNALDKTKYVVDLQEIKVIRNSGNYLYENAKLVIKAYVKK